MKKVMIAASAALVGAAAFGGLCDTITGGETPDACRAYYFKASVKLLDGKYGKVPAGSICDKDGTAYWRVGATRKVKGVFFDCDTCNLTNAAAANSEAFLWGADQTGVGDFAHFYLSTSASKYKVVSHTSTYDPALKEFTGDDDTYGSGAYKGSAVYDFKILNFFGAASKDKAKKAEALIAIDFAEFDQYNEIRTWSILCAGFGAQAGGMVKNLSGNLAGAASAATYCGIPTVVFEPCKLDPSYDSIDNNGDMVPPNGNENVPWGKILVDETASWPTDAISGTWALKYNAAASKAAYGSTVLKKVFGANYEFIETKKNSAGNYIYAQDWVAPLIIKKAI